MADSKTSIWHTFGMEWKEHIGWLTPFLATPVAFIALRHPKLLADNEPLRRAVTRLFFLAFLAAAIAGGLGALINNVAPNDFLKGPGVQ